jgi:nicotinamide-nucleotide amidase
MPCRVARTARGRPPDYAAVVHPLLTAELLSIGSELTVGETRDTNAGDLARDLTERGVVVGRISALPDNLPAIREAFTAAVGRADLVISTGGLGPTPDDLTRESIAAMVGETPAVDPELATWLRGLFDRRGLPFPEANLKQAWLIPSALPIANERGTAPGWWVDRPAGRLIVALPGPPREMRAMWEAEVLPRLLERGLGRPMVVTTLRTTGIGESLVADRLGTLLARDANPTVATYARADAVDIRISAIAEDVGDAAGLVAAAEERVLGVIGDRVWGRGTVTWPAAIGEALGRRGWRLAFVEVGLRGALVALLAEGLADRLAFAEILDRRPAPHDGHPASLEHLAARVRELGPSEIGLAVEARPRRGDTAVSVAVVDPAGEARERRIVFLDGAAGRSRAAIAAAGILLDRLRRSAV